MKQISSIIDNPFTHSFFLKVDRERPVESYVSQRLLENEVEPMDLANEMEVSPVKTHNLIQINTIDGPLPYPTEDFTKTLEDFSVNYQGNLLEVPIGEC